MMKKITNFSKSDAYRAKIHDLIPGGAHTYSKGDDQFPRRSPAAIAKGKGAWVWDIDGNQFLDCSMGLTSVSLGHAYEPVLKAVRAELLNGVNFQRPASIELAMAEKFLQLVPSHQMIKFSKNGSTATTAAVKLARAFTNRDLVACPGDHPFYSYDDWFIGQTACARGIPQELKSLSVTFDSQNLSTLEDLFKKYPGRIACVISEPEKTSPLPENYNRRLIEISHQHGALFIQDEMVTGFKTDFPGSMKKLNVEPDLATWGKGIANGFSFCALTGKKEVMELGGIRQTGQEKVFLISTTHGGETHALAAAMATIDIFKTQNVIKKNHATGRQVRLNSDQAIKKAGLEKFISVYPEDWMLAYSFKDKNGQASSGLRTLFLQEMIARGVLFQGAFIPSFSHTQNEVDFFAEAFTECLGVYTRALESGYEKLLVGEPAKAVFRKFL